MLLSFLLEFADLASKRLQVILEARIRLLYFCLVCHDETTEENIYIQRTLV